MGHNPPALSTVRSGGSGAQQLFNGFPSIERFLAKNHSTSAAHRASLQEAARNSSDLRVGMVDGPVALGAMPLPKIANDVSALPDRRVMTTRREFVGGATALAVSPNAMPACDGAITDPIITLIAAENRWRLVAVAARARAERLLFALPKDERPEEFDDHPIMAEALLLETRADEIYDRIIETPASTLAAIFAKLEWGEGEVEVTEGVIADLRRWLRARS
jgi:hypothetical protein